MSKFVSQAKTVSKPIIVDKESQKIINAVIEDFRTNGPIRSLIKEIIRQELIALKSAL